MLKLSRVVLTGIALLSLSVALCCAQPIEPAPVKIGESAAVCSPWPFADWPHPVTEQPSLGADSYLAPATSPPPDGDCACITISDSWAPAQAENEKKKDSATKKKIKAKQAKLKAAVGAAHKGVFYANDFAYVLDADYSDWWPGDRLKRIPRYWPGFTMDVGGQYRLRSQHERNFRGLGLTGVDDDFLLHRTRLYGNLQFGSRLRVFAEYIDAVSNYENFGARPIEENRSDLLNLFADGVLLDSPYAKLIGRIGRQELLYGAQRAVTPLDWANTRLTFDGAKLLWQGTTWDIDGFWTRPLRRSITKFDAPNLNLQFYGIYASYKQLEKDKLECYWLAFDNDVTGARFDSLGGRYLGHLDNWRMEIWGNYQIGRNADDSSHHAGAWTLGCGRVWDHAWQPELWVYYDWASGANEQGAGNGYFHFFPLAHKYLGFIDLFGRRNIEAPNVLFTFKPAEKLKVLLWYYYLFLENKNDTPYSVAMTPFFPGVTPGSADLGHEIDAALSFAINPRTSVLLGYSHFFSGRYYDTPGLPYSGGANFFYAQCQFNF